MRHARFVAGESYLCGKLVLRSLLHRQVHSVWSRIEFLQCDLGVRPAAAFIAVRNGPKRVRGNHALVPFHVER